MQITVTIPDELAAKASAQGLSPEAYVESLVADLLNTPRGYGANRALTRQEFQASLDRMAEGSENIPSLPDEALTRESFYQGHD